MPATPARIGVLARPGICARCVRPSLSRPRRVAGPERGDPRLGYGHRARPAVRTRHLPRDRQRDHGRPSLCSAARFSSTPCSPAWRRRCRRCTRSRSTQPSSSAKPEPLMSPRHTPPGPLTPCLRRGFGRQAALSIRWERVWRLPMPAWYDSLPANHEDVPHRDWYGERAQRREPRYPGARVRRAPRSKRLCKTTLLLGPGRLLRHAPGRFGWINKRCTPSRRATEPTPSPRDRFCLPDVPLIPYLTSRKTRDWPVSRACRHAATRPGDARASRPRATTPPSPERAERWGAARCFGPRFDTSSRFVWRMNHRQSRSPPYAAVVLECSRATPRKGNGSCWSLTASAPNPTHPLS